MSRKIRLNIIFIINVKLEFFKCIGIMLANLCHPYKNTNTAVLNDKVAVNNVMRQRVTHGQTCYFCSLGPKPSLKGLQMFNESQSQQKARDTTALRYCRLYLQRLLPSDISRQGLLGVFAIGLGSARRGCVGRTPHPGLGGGIYKEKEIVSCTSLLGIGCGWYMAEATMQCSR